VEDKLKEILKTIKINETTISTIMGGVVVVIVAILMFNYFKSINQLEGETTSGTSTEIAEEVREGDKPSNLPTTYIVKKGDDLWHIAEKFFNSGYNFTDIALENRITNVNVIIPGQELAIPQVEAKKVTVATISQKSTKPAIESSTYVTQAGDYLWDIAVRAYGDGYAWPQIYEVNKAVIGPNPDLLPKGVTLNLAR